MSCVHHLSPALCPHLRVAAMSKQSADDLAPDIDWRIDKDTAQDKRRGLRTTKYREPPLGVLYRCKCLLSKINKQPMPTAPWDDVSTTDRVLPLMMPSADAPETDEFVPLLQFLSSQAPYDERGSRFWSASKKLVERWHPAGTRPAEETRCDLSRVFDLASAELFDLAVAAYKKTLAHRKYQPSGRRYTRTEWREFDNAVAQGAAELMKAVQKHPELRSEPLSVLWPEHADAEKSLIRVLNHAFSQELSEGDVIRVLAGMAKRTPPDTDRFAHGRNLTIREALERLNERATQKKNDRKSVRRTQAAPSCYAGRDELVRQLDRRYPKATDDALANVVAPFLEVTMILTAEDAGGEVGNSVANCKGCVQRIRRKR